MLSACAAAQSGARPDATTLSLHLARADGRTIELDAYAGKPLLLFLLATYDQASQVALISLTEFAKQEPSTQIAGVLVQPDAATFLPLFKDSVEVPFELYDDPEQRILHGQSALGKLRGVPAFVLLDAAGHIRDVGYGVLKVEEIKQFVAQ
jgi:peroxiredoxin